MKRRNSIVISEKEFGVHEECGIIGIHSKAKQPLARDVYFGLFALQHRGQESAGIAVSVPDNKIAYYKNMGLVSEVFGEDELTLLPNTTTSIGHVRYSTSGSSNVVNAQPVVFYGRYGRMAIAHNGNIINAPKIKDTLIASGHIFQSSTDCEVMAALINELATKSVEQGLFEACRKFVGAFAFVLLAGPKLFAVRDSFGLSPLIMGEKEGEIVFASESSALDAIDATIIRDLVPGEIITVNEDGSVISSFFNGSDKKPCIFEYVYLARSDSTMDGVSVYDARYECGKMLAKLFDIKADIVAGVPDSALVSARGYSAVSGIPYVDALSKNRYIGRTFIQPEQSQRESSVKIKLNAFRSNIKGKRLILIDDSIVRGTTSKKIISLLRQSGATEVHMLVASPIVKWPCFFGVDMDTKEQLIGGNRSCDEICEIIGADSLHYIPQDLLIQACGGGNFCTGCFDCNYSIDKNIIEANGLKL
ncbi:MAG TPA: amidophosphoribosyltransferase [Clostridia bacterium]|nr:amidophosphoribosyltransferase [Clostridia bacterium]